MGPRSPSRSATPRGSYSPGRRTRRRRSYSRPRNDYQSISKSRHPPSPPLPPSRDTSNRDNGHSRRRSASGSESPRYYRRHIDSRRRSRTRSLSRSHSRSRSPYDRNNRYNREKPTPTRCLGVFGLNVATTQQKIREIFSKYGPIDRIHVVIDATTRRSRGFCFIYYRHLADAEVARENCCGLEVDGRRIRVAYSITERPHTPTPGVYRGRSTKALRESLRSQQRPRSPSPYRNRGHHRRYDRSRSRSHSPRRYRY